MVLFPLRTLSNVFCHLFTALDTKTPFLTLEVSFFGHFLLAGRSLFQLFQQSRAALENVGIGGAEVPGVPGVGHVLARPAAVVHEQGHFPLRVSAVDAVQMPQVFVVHGNDPVIVVIIGPGGALCGMSFAGNAVRIQLPRGRRIHRVADFLVCGGRGINFELPLTARRPDQIQHDILCHGAPADVAVADKQDLGHTFLVLLYAKICVVLRTSLGFLRLLFKQANPHNLAQVGILCHCLVVEKE